MSDDEERRRLLANVDGGDADEQSSASKFTRWKPLASLSAMLLLLLGGTVYFAAHVSVSRPDTGKELLSNGTHEFKRTVILVSIDGLRADYLDRGLTPHLLDISKQGIRAKYMKPIFPTVTFPNHWALMTGLHAESHGIIANSFWDPTSETMFLYNRISSLNSTWWLGEPMWETAERAGVKTANLMWPGPPITSSGTSPTYSIPWRDKVPLQEKLDQILQWIDMDIADRPELIMAYEPSLDQAGHAWGPMSKAVNETLRSVDVFAHSLHHEILARNLSDIADVIFVSDHGMADTSEVDWIHVDDPSILGSADPDDVGGPTWQVVTHADGWPSMGLHFTPGTDQRDVLKRLMRATRDERYIGKFDVFVTNAYTGSSASGDEDEDDLVVPMPERYHYSNNERIAPIWIIPRLGYALTTKERGDNGMSFGNHGYDNEEPAMHAIFVAHGPFSSGAKAIASRNASPRANGNAWHSITDEAYVMQGFPNIEIYNLVMRLLDISQFGADTNGTVGFWDDYLEV
ncbi:alkaline-phosphatase-like protein [Scleroderma citrinum]